MSDDAALFRPWPFTGRRAEVAAAVAGWQEGRGLALVGAHGSGRTRVAERVGARVGEPVVPAHAWAAGDRGRAIIDGAEGLSTQERAAALAAGCLLVLPRWATPDSAESVLLPPLDAAGVSTVLHRALGRPVAAGAVALLAQSSRGNLRALVELTRGSHEAGVLMVRDGAWQLQGAPQPTRLLVERVEQSLAALEPGPREGVELVALGEPVALDWLEQVMPGALESVRACPLVCGLGHLQLRDEVAREIVLAATPSLRARRLARRLVDSGLGDPAQRAVWAQVAGLDVGSAEGLAAARALLASGGADRAAAVLARTDPSPEVELARAALLVHEGRGAEVEPSGPSHRLAAASRQVGGLPGLGGPGADLLDGPVWPATGVAWDPFPSVDVVDAIVAARSGSIAEATVSARRALAAAGSGWAPDLAWAALALGWVALAAGRPATAMGRGRDVVAAAQRLGWPGLAGLGQAITEVAGAWTGVRADASGEAAVPGDPVLAGWLDTWRRRAAAWSAAAEGRTAIDVLVAGAQASGERGDFMTVLELASDVRRLGEPRPALELLRRCPPGPALLALEVQAAEAALAGDPQQWARAADGFLALGARAQAAECLVQCSRAMGGSRGAAVGARAADLIDECEGLRSPLLSSVRAALTAREREVAVMAADGHPSSNIAERLGISVRTVDNLLARCYTKLDVSGRRDLPAALGLVGEVR